MAAVIAGLYRGESMRDGIAFGIPNKLRDQGKIVKSNRGDWHMTEQEYQKRRGYQSRDVKRSNDET